MRILAWLLVAPVVLWALMRLGGLDRGYPLVPAVAFTPHATATALGVVLALVALRQWRPLAVAALATVALVATVLPRALGGGDAEGPRLRVLTANATYGRVSAETLRELVRRHDVDLLSVQELTPGLAARLRGVLPHAVTAPAAGASGTGLYSRLPLEEIAPPTGSPLRQVAGRTPGFEVAAVHPPPPVSGRRVAQWQATFAGLPRGDRPRLLLGDFNATLDHRELRRLLDSGYVDAADATGDGLAATFPANRRRPGITIDHVLATKEFTPVRTDVLRLAGSDHHAVLAVLACATTC